MSKSLVKALYRKMKHIPWVVSISRVAPVMNPVRALWFDVRSRQNRYEYLEHLLRSLPGSFGIAVRFCLLKGFFGHMGANVVIWPGTRFRYPGRIELADGVSISYDCILQGGGGISIGSSTLIGPGVKIWSVNHCFKDTHRTIGSQGYEGRPVSIGRDCWIGSDSFVKPGTLLPDGCVLLPGSVVGRMRIPEYSVLSGNPATVMGPRSRVGCTVGWGAVDKTVCAT